MKKRKWTEEGGQIEVEVEIVNQIFLFTDAFEFYDHAEDEIADTTPKPTFVEKIFRYKFGKIVKAPKKLPDWVNKYIF